MWCRQVDINKGKQVPFDLQDELNFSKNVLHIFRRVVITTGINGKFWRGWVGARCEMQDAGGGDAFLPYGRYMYSPGLKQGHYLKPAVINLLLTTVHVVVHILLTVFTARNHHRLPSLYDKPAYLMLSILISKKSFGTEDGRRRRKRIKGLVHWKVKGHGVQM